MNNKTLCALIDCSRNAVMTPDAMKQFISILSKMGYNAAMLYTEDTFELPNYPLFGYMRGGYTMAELKDLDDYANSVGVELIPCVQMLAHLGTALRWGFLPRDANDILLVDDEETYKYVDHVFETVSKCFRSKRIHIGLDEAAMLGRGKFLKLHGYEPTLSILRRHMIKVKSIADKYGYSLIMWSDMFFHEFMTGSYSIEKMELPKSVIESLPEGIIPAYWEYFATDEKKYDDMLYNHKQLSKDVWYTGCIWGWKGIIPFNKLSINTIRPAINACEKNGVNSIVVGLWGDDGAECSHYSQLPSLYFVGAYARGERDEEKIKAGFEEMFGVPFDKYIEIDLPNQPGSAEWGTHWCNPAKYMFYSDYFNGFNDYSVNEADEAKYSEYSAKLKETAAKAGKLSYVFESAAALCDVMSKKYALGLKTRRAYRSGDKEELRRLLTECYEPLPELIEKFYVAFKAQWDRENRPSGFDVQDLRIGGLIHRTKACIERLRAYLDGTLSEIRELEVDLVPLGKEGVSRSIMGPYLYTPNVYSSQ